MLRISTISLGPLLVALQRCCFGRVSNSCSHPSSRKLFGNAKPASSAHHHKLSVKVRQRHQPFTEPLTIRVANLACSHLPARCIDMIKRDLTTVNI
jgi:hypothetical protein